MIYLMIVVSGHLWYKASLFLANLKFAHKPNHDLGCLGLLVLGLNQVVCGSGLPRKRVGFNPGEKMIDISMRQMLEAGVHFGHKTRYWNPKMGPFIYGSRFKVHIINLEHTKPMLMEALKFMGNVASRRGKVLFVGTKHAAQDIIREEATRCGMPFVDYRWLGGMLTNYKTIRQSIKRLKELEALLAGGNVERMIKKELLTLMREKDKLEACLAGIKNMGSLPDVLFVIDVGHEKIAISEAKRLGIPVVGIVDTNASPEGIDYPIPGNDDALRSIRLYCQAVADTIIEARGVVEPVLEEEVDLDAEDKSAAKKIITKKAKLADKKRSTLASEYDEDAVEDLEEAPVVEVTAAVVVEPEPIAAEAKPVRKVALKKPAAKAVAENAEPVAEIKKAKKPAAKKPAAKKTTQK